MSDYTGPVNIGNPNELTVRGLAEKVIELTGTRSRIEVRPLPEDDPKVRRPDITLARRILSWEPRVTLEQGLSATIPYFEKRIQQETAAAPPVEA
jgi:nucleoside-diphosphate-sugar epimerase